MKLIVALAGLMVLGLAAGTAAQSADATAAPDATSSAAPTSSPAPTWSPRYAPDDLGSVLPTRVGDLDFTLFDESPNAISEDPDYGDAWRGIAMQLGKDLEDVRVAKSYGFLSDDDEYTWRLRFGAYRVEGVPALDLLGVLDDAAPTDWLVIGERWVLPIPNVEDGVGVIDYAYPKGEVLFEITIVDDGGDDPGIEDLLELLP